MTLIHWEDTIICPNCGERMQLTEIDENIKLYQHNQPCPCVLALRAELMVIKR